MEEKTVWRFAILTLLIDIAFLLGANVLASSLPGNELDVVLPQPWFYALFGALLVSHLVLAVLIFLVAKPRGVWTALLWALFAFIAGFVGALLHRVRERLMASIAGFWRNPSLLGVMLLDFIARAVLITVFMQFYLMTVVYINKTALASMTQDTATLGPLLNPPTIAVTVVFALIAFMVMLYINSFFAAGQVGMSKNFVKDGSTTFAEFMPSVKRYWQPVFRLLFIRYSLMFLVSIPAIIALVIYLATPQSLITVAQWTFLMVAMLIALAFCTVIYAWLLYGEPAIGFEELEAWESAKRSGSLVKSRFGATVINLLAIFTLFMFASTIVGIFLAPFDYQVQSAKDLASAQTWTNAREITKQILQVITICASIIATLFVFLSFNELVGGRPAAKPIAGSKAKAPVKAQSASDDHPIPKTVIKRKPVPVKKHT